MCSALNSYILSNLAGHYNFKLHAIFYGWCIFKIFHAWISTNLKTISWFSFFRETKYDTKNTQQIWPSCLFQSYAFFFLFLNIRKFLCTNIHRCFQTNLYFILLIVAFTIDFTWFSLGNWKLHSKLLKSMLSSHIEQRGFNLEKWVCLSLMLWLKELLTYSSKVVSERRQNFFLW